MDNHFTNNDSGDLFSADELLDGMPLKRARVLLYLIESQTVKLSKESERVAMNYLPIMSDPAMAYLTAFTFTEGTETTIQALEEYAEDWAYLVPKNLALQAVLIHLIAEKYDLVKKQISDIRTALGMDNPSVQEQYQTFYGVPLETIYKAEGLSLAWSWTNISKRLENMPTFWVTFFLTLPLGPGLLALPIALAGIGVIPGVILLILFGLLNMFTAAAIAESFSRTGEGRYGFAFVGRLVEHYLGRGSSIFLTIVMFLNLFLVLIVFYLGIAGTLSVLTGISAIIWVILAFLLGLFFLSRGSFNATIASSIIIGLASIFLVLLILLLAFGNMDLARLTRMELPVGGNFSVDILASVFGIMLTSYFNHLLIGNYAKVALRRDPSSRSFINGSMAAIALTIVLSCLWLISMSGAIDHNVLLAEKGTVLVPLAGIVGGWVNLLGSIFIMLSLGLASIHISFGLYFTVQERIGQLANLKVFGPALKSILEKPSGRFILGIFPVFLSMLSTIYVLQTGSSSFSFLLSFLGVVSLSLLGGIYPIQLIVSSRNRGNVLSSTSYKLLGNRFLLAFAYFIFLISIFAHGLFIWTDPIQRLGAILVGIFAIVTTYMSYRTGSFKPRLVLEFRKLSDTQAVIAMIGGGEAAFADILLNYVGQEESHRKISELEISLRGLRSIHLAFDTHNMNDLEVWVHYLHPDNSSEPLDARLQLSSGNPSVQIKGQYIVPVRQPHYDLQLQLD